MKTSKKPKNMFPYAGGKHAIIDSLNTVFSNMVYNRFYDLFGGSGTIIFSGEIGCDNKTMNDREKNIAILYFAFKDYDTMLKIYEKLEETPLTKDNFYTAKEAWISYFNNPVSIEELFNDNNDYFVELAAYAYMLHICYYCGVINTKHNVTITDAIIDKYEKYTKLSRFEDYNKALEEVEVCNKDALSIINSMVQNPSADETSFLYLDVPYLSSNQTTMKTSDTYKCSTSEADHKAWFEAANKLPRSNYLVAISNYSNDLYDGLARAYGWHKIFLAERAVSSGIRKGSSERARECEYIYCNFEFERDDIYMEF